MIRLLPRLASDLPALPTEPKRTATEPGNNPPTAAAKTPAKVWNFSFSIGGDRPIVIKGTISEGTADGPEAPGH